MRHRRERAGADFAFTRPTLPAPEEWTPFLAPAYEQRWFSNGGPVAERLEAELAAHLVSPDREVVLVCNATAGLTAALLALEVRGAVAVPSFTFPATAHAVQLAGCTPVLCDVERETWELGPAAATAAVRERGCAAIVHVRPFGLCRDLAPLEAAAADAGVSLVVDAAAAFGTSPSACGDAEVFSFHATKVFAVGEGGAVATSPAVAERIRHVSNFALAGSMVTGRGMNAKMSDVTAAIGLAMLRRLDEHVGVRRAVVARFGEAIGTAAELPRDPGATPWQTLPVLVSDEADRDAVIAALRARGVDARTYYSPGLHRTTAFRSADALPVTDELTRRVVCLPVYSDLAGRELDTLSEHVAAAFAGG
jgi:dTDP-4-amino-4,6-dideoxygalactose transaminase